jgi:alkylation response protein AidB-like acyl-CoA dehydrogenase
MSLLSRGSRTLASHLTKSGAACRAITTHSQLPEEHKMLYEMCRRFADEEIIPNARAWDQKHEFPDKVKDLVRNLLLVSFRNFILH